MLKQMLQEIEMTLVGLLKHVHTHPYTRVYAKHIPTHDVLQNIEVSLLKMQIDVQHLILHSCFLNT